MDSETAKPLSQEEKSGDLPDKNRHGMKLSFLAASLLILAGVSFVSLSSLNKQTLDQRSRAAFQPPPQIHIFITPASHSRLALGVYVPQPNTYNGSSIDSYKQETGKYPAFSWLPMTWKRLTGEYWQFDPQMLEEFRTRGIMPGLTWEPSRGPVEAYPVRQIAINQTEFSWKSIATGLHDRYITQFARDSAAYRYPFVIRVLHEMDGSWYPWGYSVNGNTDPKDYVKAYRHIVDIFRRENASNVRFVWGPSALDATLIQKYGNILSALFPGDNYADWIALDGYSDPQNSWRTLQDEFLPSYDFLTSLSARPMMIFETGTMENPADPMFKANWIIRGFLTAIPEKLPRVKAAVWFNSKDGSGRDFTIASSQNSLNAWRQVVASPLYQAVPQR